MKNIRIICDTKHKREMLTQWLINEKICWTDGRDFITRPIFNNAKTIDFGYRDDPMAATWSSYMSNDECSIIYDIFDRKSIKSLLDSSYTKLTENDFHKLMEERRNESR